MKRILITIAAVAALLHITVFHSGAESAESEYNYGGEVIIEALPDDVANDMQNRGITPENGGALSISAGDAVSYITDTVKNEINGPFKLFLMLTGVIMLCALADSLRDGADSGGGSDEAFRMAGVICCAGMMSGYIALSITRAGDILRAGVTFFNVFIPVFAGIIAVSGKIATASVMCGVIIAAAQLISQLILVFLVPLCTSLFGVSIAGAINPDLKIERIGVAVRKIVTWALGVTITVFVGLLSVQSFIAGAADSVTLRAAKFAVSNSVPIVGGAVSDALATVKSSIVLVQNTTGTFGIIALTGIMLPPVLSLICYRMALSVSATVSEMFGVDALTKLIKSGETVLSIIFAMLAAFMVLAIISTALMLLINNAAAV